MFERFTERGRQVVRLAEMEARALKHLEIGTAHLLIALLREEEGLAALVLEQIEVTLDDVRVQFQGFDVEGGEAPQQIPFSSDAKYVLELALREALSLGHNYIGTEHILLAISRHQSCDGEVILRAFGTSAEDIRNRTIRMLTGPGRQKTPKAPLPDASRQAIELSLQRTEEAIRLDQDRLEAYLKEVRVLEEKLRQARQEAAEFRLTLS